MLTVYASEVLKALKKIKSDEAKEETIERLLDKAYKQGIETGKIIKEHGSEMYHE